MSREVPSRASVNGGHHITLSVGGAQEDVDFHTGTRGMRFIKRTVLFDGSKPIYHLYYANADADPGSVVTTFPLRQAGVLGRRGTNQAREVLLAAPSRSLDYWSGRLTRTRHTGAQHRCPGWAPVAVPPPVRHRVRPGGDRR